MGESSERWKKNCKVEKLRWVLPYPEGGEVSIRGGQTQVLNVQDMLVVFILNLEASFYYRQYPIYLSKGP